jgi:hypothetical protein
MINNSITTKNARPAAISTGKPINTVEKIAMGATTVSARIFGDSLVYSDSRRRRRFSDNSISS